jgi:hypothetical protein
MAKKTKTAAADTYTVAKPFDLDNIPQILGATITLSPRQAKYLLLDGKIKRDLKTTKKTEVTNG